MDGFAPFLVGGFFAEAITESVSMWRSGTLQWEHLAALVFAFFFAMAGRLNILLVAGLPFDNDLGYFLSYATFALIAMRGSGAIHDIYKRVTG